MKLHFSLLSFAALTMTNLHSAQAQDVCLQSIQPAVSPSGVCQEFSTPCEVPEDWKSVPSCDLIDTTADENKPSLEQKMNSRLSRMRAYWQMKKGHSSSETQTHSNQSFNKIGSGSYTRSNRYRKLPTSTGATTQGVRASNRRDYSSDIAKRYSLRGGYQRAGDTTAAERKERRQARASFRSRSDATRTGNLNTTIRWNVLSDQFTTKKTYGTNPYRLRSKYQQEQAAKRALTNKEIDIHERMMSRSRKYRGERLEGNLSGDALLDN